MKPLLSQELSIIAGGRSIMAIEVLNKHIAQAKEDGCTLVKTELSDVKTDNPLFEFGLNLYATEEIENICRTHFKNCAVKYILTCASSHKEAVKQLYHRFVK
jgi:hypothetical protein